ncbi:MAG: S46 family peptidase [Bacteroidaceae bacterium]|nr:S46 family peptidase [Bacteroidaceae bacterium]
MNKTLLTKHSVGTTLLLALLLLTNLTTLHADEGMWLLGRTDPKAMAVARQLGLQLTDSELYGEGGESLKDCVVDFGDYCSGVIVSSDGLLFTNHHCGFSSIQKLSTPEDDILGNGFVARSHEEERPVEGLYVKIWQRSEDVTEQVDEEMQKIYEDTSKGRKLGRNREQTLYTQYIGSVLSHIAGDAAQKAEKEGQLGIVCEAKAFEGGRVYLLNYYKTYSDIRLVFTVPQSLGKFGGDTDNWMWPRQTADFSVFRIYADSLGQPADYSEKNIPLHPRRWARVSLDGFSQGSYCMTIGYPGSTNRYLSSYGIEERVGVTNIPMIQVRGCKQDIWTKWMRAERAIGIKYASKFAGSSNYWKNSQGMNEAVERLGIIEQKREREQEIRRWYSADKELRSRFSRMFPTLYSGYKKRHDARYAQGFVSETFYRGIELFGFARMAKRAAEAHPKMREALNEAMRNQYKDYDPRVDEEVMAVLLENYAQQVSAKYLPRFYQEISKKYNNDYAAFARDVFSKSKLTTFEGWYGMVNAEVRSSLTLEDSLEQELADENAYQQYVSSDRAVALYDELEQMVTHVISPSLRRVGSAISYNEDLLTQAVLEMEMDQPHYSDANFTMRMSYGIVSDYTNAGTHHDFLTTMPSLIEKIEKGRENPDYAMQAEILALLKSGDYGRYKDAQTGQLPLCFLTTNDITGGNSGSPMFNGKGELIGLAFDGNWDALSSDISFDSSLTRCIGVDIRFVLWLMEKWGHADHLIQEIGG